MAIAWLKGIEIEISWMQKTQPNTSLSEKLHDSRISTALAVRATFTQPYKEKFNPPSTVHDIENLPRPAPLGPVPVMVVVGAAVVVTAGSAIRVTAHLANVTLEPTGQWTSSPSILMLSKSAIRRLTVLLSNGLKGNQ